jgi:hypothetical protein
VLAFIWVLTALRVTPSRQRSSSNGERPGNHDAQRLGQEKRLQTSIRYINGSTKKVEGPFYNNGVALSLS